MKAALLVCDMTNEQVANLAQARKKTIVSSIQQLAELPQWTIKLDSRLWLHNNKESTLSQVYPDCGTTMALPNTDGADLLQELKGCNLQFVEKKHFSSFVHSKLMETLQLADITHVFIAGINTDYCIFNTALDSFARGKFQTHVVEEGVGSVAGSKGHEQGLTWIRSHMGPDSVVSLAHAVKMISG